MTQFIQSTRVIPPGSTARSALRSRRGLTLVEVIVSLCILTVVLLALGLFSANFAHATAVSRMRITSTQLAEDRIDSAKSSPRYSAIESLYVKTETSIAGYPGYTRQTWVRRTGGGVADTTDFKSVTVQVTNAQAGTTVRKTTVIAPY